MRRRLRRIRERRERRRQTPRANLRRFLASVRERGLDPRHVVDVGANVGRWTERALQAFPTCRITMLEPQVEMTRHLERLCAAHERARWIQAAVGKACGEAVLTVNDDPTSSSLAYSAEDAAAHGWERRVVPVVTLDHLAKAELKAIPEIVKLDAEGSRAGDPGGRDIPARHDRDVPARAGPHPTACRHARLPREHAVHA